LLRVLKHRHAQHLADGAQLADLQAEAHQAGVVGAPGAGAFGVFGDGGFQSSLNTLICHWLYLLRR
jgi:hypothetical protein